MIAITGIHFVLAGLALLGFLPLVVILYKSNRAKKILTTGSTAKATVFEIRTVYSSPRDIVHYEFYLPQSSQPFRGRLTTAIGKFKQGEQLEVFYLPDKPHRNTIQGAWSSNFLIVFGIVIAAFVLFAVFKLYEML
jgi:hypothetical protein